MKISVKEILVIQRKIREEQEKLNAVKTEIVECMGLDLVDSASYENIMAHLDEKVERLHKTYDAVCKYHRIYCSVPVTGPMARKKKSDPETLSDDDKALIREAYEASFPDFG